MLIREATGSDAALLAPLFQAWDHPLPDAEIQAIVERWASTRCAAILVAEPNGSTRSSGLVGMAAVAARPGLSDTRPVAHLSGLVVHPNQRRSGVGASLLDAAEAIALEWGCRRIELSSSLTRDAAQRFYPARGYEDRTVHHAYYGKRLVDPGPPSVPG